MYTIKYIVLGLVILFTFYSYETDFYTTADWKDITVVYGIIDQNDSIQHIKINRALSSGKKWNCDTTKRALLE